jgi:YidC/Oxa1 family membrane protein insertase
MNRNAIIFVVASLAILIGWQSFYDSMYPPVRPVAGSIAAPAPAATSAGPAAQAPAAAAAAPASAVTAAPAAARLTSAPEKVVRLQTEAYDVALSSWGARFIELTLRGVPAKLEEEAEFLDLVSSADNPRYGSLEIPGLDLTQGWTLLTPKPEAVDGQQVVRFSLKPAGVPLELHKSFRFPAQGNRFSVDVQVINRSAQALSLAPLSLLWGPNLGGSHTGIGMFPAAGVVQLEGKIERESASSDSAMLSYSKPRWVALKNHYFVAGYFPKEGAWNRAEIRKLGGDKVQVALVAEGLSLLPGQAVSLSADAYAGPQDYDKVKAIGNNFQRVVQFQYYQIFDWLNPLSIGLLHLLKWFESVTGNWGVAIILLTLVVRGLMFWPSLKSMVSMRRMQTKMAAMQPRLETLKKVYKDDPNKLNQEMMKLYKEFGVNPLGGCLPMLLQIPVFFALYGTLNAAFELRGAEFMWKWTDLTAGDPTHFFPIAMGLTMFLQQKLAPISATMSDEQQQMQKMMLWLFPIMFTGMALFMAWPVGLLLYWTASNIFGILQQLAVNKAVD